MQTGRVIYRRSLSQAVTETDQKQPGHRQPEPQIGRPQIDRATDVLDQSHVRQQAARATDRQTGRVLTIVNRQNSQQVQTEWIQLYIVPVPRALEVNLPGGATA